MTLNFNFIKPSKIFFSILWAIAFLLTAYGYVNYSGTKLIYVVFSIVSHCLLFLGFNSKSIFFDAFIGAFLWLGFWLKFTLRIVLFDGSFTDPIGLFDHTPLSFDKALIVSIVGISGLILASLVRRFFFFKNIVRYQKSDNKALDFYFKNRFAIWTIYLLAIFIVASSNLVFGFYQKGVISNVSFPFGLGSVYKWLLLFGFASISAVILDAEFRINKKISLYTVMLALLEAFLSNVSMLSRGMILNSSALFYGVFVSYRLKNKMPSFRLLVISLVIFFVLFVTSLQIVNLVRDNVFVDSKITTETIRGIGSKNYVTLQMFTDRWVGIEGVLAVTSNPNLGWTLWKDALSESYNENDTSFYDKNIAIDSPYFNTDKSKHHFLSLPGGIAFLFYPGSYIFFCSQ